MNITNKKNIDNQIETILTNYLFELMEQTTFDNIDEDIFTILSNNNIHHYDIAIEPNYIDNSITIDIKGNNIYGEEYKSTFKMINSSILSY